MSDEWWAGWWESEPAWYQQYFDASQNWDETQNTLFDAIIGDSASAADDPYLEGLLHTAFFEPGIDRDTREETYQYLVEYLWDEYEIDFEDVFDWEEYREWYDNTYGGH